MVSVAGSLMVSVLSAAWLFLPTSHLGQYSLILAYHSKYLAKSKKKRTKTYLLLHVCDAVTLAKSKYMEITIVLSDKLGDINCN